MRRRNAVIMAVLVIAMMSANAYADDITDEGFVTSDVALEEPAVSSDTVSEEPPEAASEGAEEGDISDITPEIPGEEEIVGSPEIIPETPKNELIETPEQPDTAMAKAPAKCSSTDEARARIRAGKEGDEIGISDLCIPAADMEELLIGLPESVDEISFVDDGNIILSVILGSFPEDEESAGYEESCQHRKQTEEYAEPVSAEETVPDETVEYFEESETQSSESPVSEPTVDVTGYAMTVLLGLAGILRIIAAI